MRSFATLFVVFVLILSSATQPKAQTADSNLRALADSAVKMFTWDVRKVALRSLMSLDVPFTLHDSTKYLTLTVAKDSARERPPIISMMLPTPIEKDKGLFFAFSRTKHDNDGGYSLELDTATTVWVPYIDCNSEFCTAMISDGFVHSRSKNKEMDVFDDLMKYDHVMFLFFDSDGHHSIAVPLFSFKKQYKELQ